MNRFNIAALCLLLASGCGGSGATTTSSGVAPVPDGKGPESVFLSGARFIPGDGSPAIEKATIIIYEGKIHDVGTDLKAPKGAELREGLEEYTIIPMMINLSSLPGLSSAGDFNAKNYSRDSLVGDLNRYVYYGVAAVVAGGDDGLGLQVRDEQKAGTATGATLHTSGRGIAAKGASGILGNVPILVGSEDEGRKAVTELADRKADLVVLWAGGMKAATAAAVIDEAHKHKLKVFVDAPALSEAKEAVKAGADALIGSVREDDVDDALISLMKEKKIALAPALSSLEARYIYLDKPKWRGEQVMLEVYPPPVSAYLGNDIFLSQLKRNPETEGFRGKFATASKNLKKMADGGVTIAFGSGSGSPWTLPGYFEHHELELMAAAGLSPAEVLKAASVSSAASLGAADMGALARGKKANFTIISGDPLTDITATKQIEEVWFNGKKLDRQDLIRNYAVRPKQITQQDINIENNLRIIEARDKAEALETHYGKFVLEKSATNLAPGLVVQTPRRSKVTKSGGPPYRVTVAYPGASADDLRTFYVATLKSWTMAGGCWEKPVPGATTKFRLCAEPSSGQIVLNITVQ